MKLSFDKKSVENLLLWYRRAKLNQPLIGWSFQKYAWLLLLEIRNLFKLQKCIYCKLEMAEIWNVVTWKYKCYTYIPGLSVRFRIWVILKFPFYNLSNHWLNFMEFSHNGCVWPLYTGIVLFQSYAPCL
jgi:hypothetical protein